MMAAVFLSIFSLTWPTMDRIERSVDQRQAPTTAIASPISSRADTQQAWVDSCRCCYREGMQKTVANRH